MPPQLEALPPHLPPQSEWDFFFFFFFFFFFLLFFFFFTYVFFTYVLSGRYRPLLQKVAKCKKYNKFKDFAFNTLAFQKVTNMTFKYSNFRALKSVNPKSSGGSAPWTPGPWTPDPRPLDPTQNRLALTRSLCALRAHVCPPKKNRLALTRSLCALRAHVCPKKIGPQQFKKSARASRSLCALRAHVCPPIINRCPLLAPPTF